MILYSGTKSPNKYIHSIQSHYRNLFFYRHIHSTECGCLYMGDIDLSDPSSIYLTTSIIVADIKTHLGHFYNYIGTIQIPHHGSKDNYKSDILDSRMNCAIISHRENDIHHPHTNVMSDIRSKNCRPFNVTEVKSTKVTQHITL